MKILIAILTFVFFSFLLNAQNEASLLKGTVSFKSSTNVYVKFESTENINIGDTLFIKNNGVLEPSLLVNNKSSISCICTPIASHKINISSELFFKNRIPKKPIKIIEEKQDDKTGQPVQKVTPIAPEQEEEEQVFKQKIKGRISAASYSNMGASDRHRMRYTFSFRGAHLNNSRFSTDNYISFRHTFGEWDKVKNNLSDALKIYSLSVKYDIDKNSSITLGRKINPRISSMGAIDGLQYERGIGEQFKLGIIAGSRPDYSDYSINFNLMQAGAYIGHISPKEKKHQQSTLGFIEQRNAGNVDRRFVYFQHSDALMHNLNLFSSFEFDLYEKFNNEVKNRPRLTNMFASLRYRFSRKIRVSLSYDNRKNIIYYESYKDYIDRLIEQETRQGFRLGFNLRPIKYVTLGVNSSLRFQKNGGNSSKNLNSYLNINRIPGINARASLTANFLETGYLSSKIYGIRLSKNIIKRKVNADAYFRMVNYNYKNSEIAVHQKIFGVNCSVRIIKKLSLYVYYEGTYNKEKPTRSRINTKIIQRF